MGEPDRQQIERAEQRLGKVLRGKWQLDELLGIGGMAAVYSATHRNGKRAAIKVLLPEAAAIPEVKARFMREGYLANKVGHPGAVSILDDDIDEDGTVFLVMELLHGETLDERWLRGGKLPWAEVLPMAYQALDVLAAAHAREIVHRDIKPGNLFIDGQGGVKVLDFGIARLQTLQLTSHSTGFDTALGTPGFMPPEQARGRGDLVDHRSDLWGLGATLYAVLAARHVHEAETANEQLALAMSAHALPLTAVCPELPEPVAAVIDKALKYDKAERWSDARAMQQAVAEAYESLTGESIKAAPRVSVLVRGSRSVKPDAPTLSADSGAERATTTRPVTEGGPAPAPKRRGVLALASVLGLVALAAWAGLRKPGAVAAPKPSSAPAVSAIAAPPPPPIASSAPADPEPPAATAPASSASAVPTKRPPLRPAGHAGKPAVKPPPSAPSIDIFQSRK